MDIDDEGDWVEDDAGFVTSETYYNQHLEDGSVYCKGCHQTQIAAGPKTFHLHHGRCIAHIDDEQQQQQLNLSERRIIRVEVEEDGAFNNPDDDAPPQQVVDDDDDSASYYSAEGEQEVGDGDGVYGGGWAEVLEGVTLQHAQDLQVKYIQQAADANDPDHQHALEYGHACKQWVYSQQGRAVTEAQAIALHIEALQQWEEEERLAAEAAAMQQPAAPGDAAIQEQLEENARQAAAALELWVEELYREEPNNLPAGMYDEWLGPVRRTVQYMRHCLDQVDLAGSGLPPRMTLRQHIYNRAQWKVRARNCHCHCHCGHATLNTNQLNSMHHMHLTIHDTLAIVSVRVLVLHVLAHQSTGHT